MNVLIIGGTRFLGAAVARELLERGCRVAVLHRGRTAGDLPPDVRHIHCDIRDRQLAEAHLKRGYDAVIDTILSDSDLAWGLPLLHHRVGRLIHCGSTGVYTPMASVPAREDDPTPCPPALGGFGQKLAQDRVLLEFHARTGFPVCSLRVSNVFGAGDVPLDVWGGRSPAYFQRVAAHRAISVPNDGRALLQPVHVSDLARGFCAALESDRIAGHIYNLSSDRAVTLSEYVAMTKALLGSTAPVRHVPVADILATGKADEAGLRFVCEHMAIDSGKARRDFGYTPRIGVRDGLRDSLAWMVRQGLLDAAALAD